ncbi:MAG: hypothetical protein ACOX8I_10855 [Bacillota bacterium]|jgi:hypothetical protein
MDEDKTITACFAPVIQGRIFGVDTLRPIANVTVQFSYGGTAVTDANGRWMKKYDPSAWAPVHMGGFCIFSQSLEGF